MLSDCNYADAYGKCTRQRYDLIPAGNYRVSADAYPAEPAYEAVDRWEQVVGFVDGIGDFQNYVENAVSCDFRPNQCCRIQHEYQKADGFSDKMCFQEAVGFALVFIYTNVVVDCPEQVASPVDPGQAGKERDFPVNCGGDVVVDSSLGKKSACVIYEEIVA